MAFKNKKVAILALSAILLFCINTFSDQGTTAATFLKLEQGVRPIGMGGAFTGAANDVNAVLWNPSGLSQLSGFEVTFMHTMWFAGIFYDYLALGYPAGEIGTFALGLVYLSSGDIPKWDELGNDKGTFSASDLGINLGYGTLINKETSVGLTIKLFNESIDSEGSFGFGADLGVMYKISKDFQAGVVVQNLGPQFGFGEAFPLPINIRLGVSFTGIRNLMMNLDYIQPIETNGIIAAGIEYWYRDMIVLRMGYQFQGWLDKQAYYENYAGPAILAGFVIGAGLKIDIYGIDYAYRQYGVLESTHRVGLTLKFK